MKKSIIYTGIAVLAFVNGISALNTQQSFVKEESDLNQAAQEAGIASITAETTGTKIIGGGGDPVSAPESVVLTPYHKTMEEIIAENNQIIEYTANDTALPEEIQNEISKSNCAATDALELAPVCSEKTMNETILQDSQIIESGVIYEAMPANLGKSRKS